MRNLRRLTALTAVALAALALSAASASAEIVDPVSGDPYVGEVFAWDTGFDDPNFETSSATITCQGANTRGTIDGNAPATGELDFDWSFCTTAGGTVNCLVNPINGVSVAFDESPAAPDFDIINTERAETFIWCGAVFGCTASSDPWNGSEFAADVDGGPFPRMTIDDVVNFSGVGCPSTGTWNAQYQITVPSDGLESNN